MFKFILAAAAAFFASSSFAETFVADAPERTVYFIGPIGPEVVGKANVVEALSAASTAPITFVINSPGGQVLPGLQLISSMRVAKLRGVKIRCLVPIMAASMAFQFLAECSERYTFANTLLLFHPMSLGVQGRFTQAQFLYFGRQLGILEKPMRDDLIRLMQIDPKVFYYHYRNETMWTADSILTVAPDFVKIVDNVKGVKGPFNLSGQPGGAEDSFKKRQGLTH